MPSTDESQKSEESSEQTTNELQYELVTDSFGYQRGIRCPHCRLVVEVPKVGLMLMTCPYCWKPSNPPLQRDRVFGKIALPRNT